MQRTLPVKMTHWANGPNLNGRYKWLEAHRELADLRGTGHQGKPKLSGFRTTSPFSRPLGTTIVEPEGVESMRYLHYRHDSARRQLISSLAQIVGAFVAPFFLTPFYSHFFAAGWAGLLAVLSTFFCIVVLRVCSIDCSLDRKTWSWDENSLIIHRHRTIEYEYTFDAPGIPWSSFQRYRVIHGGLGPDLNTFEIQYQDRWMQRGSWITITARPSQISKLAQSAAQFIVRGERYKSVLLELDTPCYES